MGWSQGVENSLLAQWGIGRKANLIPESDGADASDIIAAIYIAMEAARRVSWPERAA